MIYFSYPRKTQPFPGTELRSPEVQSVFLSTEYASSVLANILVIIPRGRSPTFSPSWVTNEEDEKGGGLMGILRARTTFQMHY